MLLTLGFRLVGIPWRPRLVLVAISLGVYCGLVGWSSPVLRATVMAWVVLGALAMDRTIRWSNVLAAAALVILWLDPAQLFDPAFH